MSEGTEPRPERGRESDGPPQRGSGPPRGGGGPPGRGRGGGRPRGRGRRRVCRFCADKSLVLDYKWSHVLQSFISERGRIVPSRTTGTCAKHQRRLTQAIKRARNAALLAYKRA